MDINQCVSSYISSYTENLYLDCITDTLYMNEQVLARKDLKGMYNEFISLPFRQNSCSLSDFESYVKKKANHFHPVDEFVESGYLNESNSSVCTKDLVDCFIFDKHLSFSYKKAQKEAAIKILDEWLHDLHRGIVFPKSPQSLLVLQGPKKIEMHKFFQMLFPNQLKQYLNCSQFEENSEDFKLRTNILRIYTNIDDIALAKRFQLERHLKFTPSIKEGDSLRPEAKKSALCATTESTITFDVPNLKLLYIQIAGIQFSKLAKVDFEALFNKFHWDLFVEPQFRADFPGL